MNQAVLDLEQSPAMTNRTQTMGPGDTTPPPPATPARRGKAKLRWILGGALLLALATFAGLHFLFAGQESTDDAQIDGNVTPIAAKISGSVTQVLVNDNQRVKAGDVLVQIDPRDYQVKVDQQQAALALAQANARASRVSVPLTAETTGSAIAAAQAQLSKAQADLAKSQAAYERAAGPALASAEAAVDSKVASARKAEADLDRMKPLADKEEISRLQYDSYVAAAGVARSQLQATRQDMEAARKGAEEKRVAVTAAEASVRQAQAALEQAKASTKQVAIRGAEVSSADASVARALADVDAAKLQLSYTAIVAPVDGVVTRKSVQPGQIVQPGQGLMVIIPLEDVWVTANFKETQLRDVRPGQRAEVDVDMLGTKIPGRVDSIAGATGARLSLLPPENATGNFVKVVQRIPVKIVLDRVPDRALLRPGMNVEATIFTGK